MSDIATELGEYSKNYSESIRAAKRGECGVYFGSVKFFKNLLSILVLLTVSVSVGLAVKFSGESRRLKADHEQLNNRLNLLVAENELLRAEQERMLSEAKKQTDDPDPDGTDPTDPDDPSNPTQAGLSYDSPYDHLFPDLYAVSNYPIPVDRDYILDNETTIYLTFDDGPSSNTRLILNHLRKHDVKATFFVMPREGSREMLNEILADGHKIGVHCYSHAYEEIYASVEAYLRDFETARNMVHEQTGVWTDIFRFPGGSSNSFNKAVYDELVAEMTARGFVYFDWNIDSNDVGGADWSKMFYGIRADVEERREEGQRSIILFHDSTSPKFTTWVIGDLIADLKSNAAGYTFGVLDTDVRPMQW